MKIFTVILLLLVTTPAHAVQHWMHSLGRAHSASLGVALSTGSDKPHDVWIGATKQAITEWNKKAQISPFTTIAGSEYITVFQKAKAWKKNCNLNGFACNTVTGGTKSGKNRKCRINIAAKANIKSAAFKKMLMLHEIGHCYSLDHNDHHYKDDRKDEDIDVSRGELMHITGCPLKDSECGVTTQAIDVINVAY